MAAATGQSTPNPLPIHGTLWFDARDYGLSAANADNTPAVQAAHDAAAAAALAAATTGNVPTAVVFIPGSKVPYQFKTPVFCDARFIEFRGDRGATRLVSSNLNGMPVFVAGIARGAGGSGNVPNSSYRPDLFGKLDATAVPGTGQRWGLRTRGDLLATGQACHFSHGGQSPRYGANVGDRWAETQKLTIEFCVEGFVSGKLPVNTSVFGVGTQSDGHPMPSMCWYVATDQNTPNTYVLALSTQATRFGLPVLSSYSFSAGTATGPQKIAIQIDTTATPAVTATVDGVQVAVTLFNGSPPVVGSNITENQYDTFVVNQNGSVTSDTTGNDFALYGLCLSRSIRYTTPGVGQAVARADSGTLSDRYRYFPNQADDPNCIGYLGFTENPSTSPRLLTITGGLLSGGGIGRPSAVYLLNGAPMPAGTEVQYVRWSDMEVGGGYTYGSAIALMGVLDTAFDRVVARGGAYGIGQIIYGANYPSHVRDCDLSGWDAGYFGYMSVVNFRDVRFGSQGLAAFRFVGCDIDVQNALVIFPGVPQQAFAFMHAHEYGGHYTFRNCLADNEGNTFDLCGIYAERHPFNQTTLRCDLVDLQTMGAVPFFILKDGGADLPPPVAVLDANLISGDFTGPFVLSGGPEGVGGAGWIGRVTGPGAVYGSHVVNVGTTPARVVVEAANYYSPPRFGQWSRGSSKFTVPAANDGQFSEIRVSTGGAIGSPSPPTFRGFDADQQIANASLAAYAIGHTSISATLNGRASSWGHLTAFGASSLAQHLFNNAALTPPATYYVGLSTGNADRGASFISEPASATGYARVAVANNSSSFTAASAGAKASIPAITLPTVLSGQTFTVRSIFLADAPAGGNAWAVIQLAAPITFTAGQTPTIAAGALTFANTPLPGTWGLLTDFGWGKLYDLAFRGTAFTAPATWFVALSTASITKTTTVLAEPSGGGYARVAVTNGAANWPADGPTSAGLVRQLGDGTNANAIAFPALAGPWGTLLEAGLTDAGSGGNVWLGGALAVPSTPTTGQVPTFAPGSFIGSAN